MVFNDFNNCQDLEKRLNKLYTKQKKKKSKAVKFPRLSDAKNKQALDKKDQGKNSLENILYEEISESARDDQDETIPTKL